MSGFEAAGLVFGAIPLLLEAFDRSERTFEFLRTYGRYAKELTKLGSILGAQNSLFRNNCFKVLTVITSDPQRARSLINVPTNDLAPWSHQDLDRSALSILASRDETFEDCQKLMSLIQESLESISTEMENFQADAVPEVNVVRRREWYRNFRNRVKLGVRKPRLEKRINELRDYNRDFDLMCLQVVRDLDTSGTWGRTQQAVFPSTTEFCTIRLASLQLHQTLVSTWDCTYHSRHCAQISMGKIHSSVSVRQPNFPQRQSSANNDSVRFELTVSGTRVEEAPVCLTVDSILDHSYLRPAISVTSGNTSNFPEKAASFDDNVPPKSGRSSRKVRFVDDDDPVPSRQASPDSKESKDSTAPQFENLHDACTFFNCQDGKPQKGCIGWLAQNGCIHLFSQPTEDASQTPKSTSLADIIAWVAEDSVTRDLPRLVLLRIAESLSTIVLQFHSTPWLSETWRSKDVLFLDIRKSETGMSYESPYLNLDIPQGTSVGDAVKLRDSSKIPDQGMSSSIEASDLDREETFRTQDVASNCARNEFLFRLGIVMLELGFAKPWSSLRQSALKILPPKRNSDYHVAEKLAQLLVNQMGPSYPRIVRKCLGCDFGLGESNLLGEELQQRFLSEVIIGLHQVAKSIEEGLPFSGTCTLVGFG